MQYRGNTPKRWLLAYACVLTLPVHAEQPVTASTADAGTLPAVTVTARKRAEDLRKVPMAVSVAEARELDELRLFDAEQLLRQVPNVGFNSLGDARSTFLAIRGIGPLAQPVGHDDTSTVVYVDGVPQPLFGSDLAFLDVERVEVMRGPQGTLFGRNAQAGAINVVTAKPDASGGGEATLEAGGDGWRRARAVLSGPLREGALYGRLAVGHDERDGDVANLAGGRVGSTENTAVRGTLVATPGEATRITLALSGQRDDNVPSNFVLKGVPGYPKVALDPEGYAHRRLGSIALTVEHTLDWAQLTSVSAFNHFDYHSLSNNSEALTFGRLFGSDYTAFVPGTDRSTYDENQNTGYQELRLSSLPGSALEWVAGANYFHDGYRMRSWYVSPFFASTNGWRDNRSRTDSRALFGEATVALGARFKLTGGLRYTRDDKRYRSSYRNNGFAGNVDAFTQQGDLDYDLWTGRLALAWAPTADTDLYASLARGAKSGGFPNFTNNAVSGVADQPYAASTSWSYELGGKQRLLGGRLALNAALFLNEVDKQSVVALDPVSYVYLPKSIDTRSYGAELELSARLTPGLALMASAGYTRAELRHVTADVAAFSGAADGNRVPGVPRTSAAVALQYRRDADWVGLSGRADLLASAQYQYVGARAADIGGHFDLAAYRISNLRLGLAFPRWEAYLFGQNLGDERPQYIGIWYGPGIETVTLGQGRLLGVGATVRF